jgi:competence protein ComEC
MDLSQPLPCVGRHPLLWVALLGGAAVMAADGLAWSAWIVGGLVLALMVQSRQWLILACGLIVAMVAGGRHLNRVDEQREHMRQVEELSPLGWFQGKIEEVTERKDDNWSAKWRTTDGRLLWWSGYGPAPVPGEIQRAFGRIEPLPESRNPGEFPFREWLYRQGVSGVFKPGGKSARLAEAPAYLQARERIVDWLGVTITHGLDPQSAEASVIRAMFLGQIPDSTELLVPFRVSGTLHAFSVSGMHVAMLAMIAWWLLRGCRISRDRAIPILIVLIFSYAWITGLKPPAMRSAIMSTLLLVGFLLRRRRDLLNFLGLALVETLIEDGHLIFQAGVQLTFGVVATLALGYPWAQLLYRWISRPEPYLPRRLYRRSQEITLQTREKVADSLAASTAAAIGSAPLVGYHFGLLSLIAIPASTLMGPAVFGVMACAFLSVLASPLGMALDLVNRANAWCARGCIEIAELSAKVPGGSFTVPRGRPAENFLLVYDLPRGGGAMVMHDSGKTTLFDCGSRRTYAHTVAPSLTRLALMPDSMILSHPDGEHIGAAPLALKDYPIQQVLLPVTHARSPAFRELLRDPGHASLYLPESRAKLPLGPEVTLEILHQPDLRDLQSLADDRVQIYRLHWRGWRIILMSDAGQRTERELMRSGVDLSADLIVYGHHGNDSHGNEDFLRAVHPRMIIVSHADFPQSEQVPDVWMQRMKSIGYPVLRQKETGAISVFPDDHGDLHLLGFVNGQEIILKH